MTEDNNTKDISRPAVSPIRLALTYAKEMEKETDINTEFIEEEPEYEPGSIGMSASAPQYWRNVGNLCNSESEPEVNMPS